MTYRYSLLPPLDGRERLDEQLHRAHRYRNQLTELERSRREQVQMAMQNGSAAVEASLAQVTDVTDRIEQYVSRMRKSREERRAKGDLPEDRAELRRLKNERCQRKQALKEAKRLALEDPAVVACLAEINAQSRAALKRARAKSALYWGTYGRLEQAAQQARGGLMWPAFARWTGDGAVAVQLQRGRPIERVLDGDDTRLRIMTALQAVPGRGCRLPRLLMRVGSVGRDPIWAEWPLVYHRPIPDGSIVKWATVTRRRDPSKRRQNRTRDSWVLLLSLEVPERSAPAPVADMVVLDLRWSRTPAGLREGGWSDDGVLTHDVIQELAVDRLLTKAADLRSIRDQNRNEMLPRMVAGLRTLGLNDEWRSRVETLASWRSDGRLGALVDWWEEHRLDGDEELIVACRDWWARCRHLWEYERGCRRRALLRRRESYRVLGARLAEKYGVLVVERINLSAAKLAQVPSPEKGIDDPSHDLARSQKVRVAPSELRASVVWAFRRRGRKVVTVSPGGPAHVLWMRARESGEQLREVEAARVRRSKRFKRLRGLPVEGDAEEGGDGEALAKPGL